MVEQLRDNVYGAVVPTCNLVPIKVGALGVNSARVVLLVNTAANICSRDRA